MIRKEVPVPGIGVYSLCPSKDKVVVELDHISKTESMAPIIVLWDEMTDMEALYEKFKEMRLKAFRPVAEALGVMYTNRHIYEALIN